MSLKSLLSTSLGAVGRWAQKNPFVSSIVKPFLKRFPNTWIFIRRAVLRQPLLEVRTYSRKEDFAHFLLPGTNNSLMFLETPQEDKRGIGRLTRELLFNIRQTLPEITADTKSKQPVSPIHFYTSIHWCPSELPPNSIVMVLDIIPMLFPDLFPAAATEWKKYFKPIVQQAKLVVTISEASADDISRVLNISRNKIHVIHCGVTLLPSDQKISIKLPEKYVVFLGSHSRHKNLDIILEALKDDRLKDMSLVLVGENSDLKHRLTKECTDDRIHLLGQLSDSEAGYVIKNAVAMVFPSLYEGFGLPPLEAALIGTPAVCSKRPAMTELLINCAEFAEPDSVEDWVLAIRKIADSPEYRDQLIAAAQAKVREYTWNNAAQKVITLCSQLDVSSDTKQPS